MLPTSDILAHFKSLNYVGLKVGAHDENKFASNSIKASLVSVMVAVSASPGVKVPPFAMMLPPALVKDTARELLNSGDFPCTHRMCKYKW